MEMQVLHGLAGILADIGDHAVAVVQTDFLGQLGDHGKDMAQQGTVLLRQGSGTLDVLFGHNKEMHLGLRVDIVKRHDLIVLIQLVRGDLALGDHTKQTIFHGNCSFRVFISSPFLAPLLGELSAPASAD